MGDQLSEMVNLMEAHFQLAQMGQSFESYDGIQKLTQVKGEILKILPLSDLTNLIVGNCESYQP